LFEGGGVANLGGVHSRQLLEDSMTAELSFNSIRDAIRLDNDDHYPKTEAICIENSHNILGGVALTQEYIDALGNLAHTNDIKLHMDGARIFNAAISRGVSVRRMCQHVDSISFCLSKGLGAPLGSVLVGSKDFIYLAKRARKRCGGGMRQAGVVAAMGLFVLQHNVDRLAEDHGRAFRFAQELMRSDVNFQLLRNGAVDTNLVFFALPEHCLITKEELCGKLEREYNVKLGGGYGVGGKVFRAAFHYDINDEGVDRAAEAIISLCR
jgi:threonine aldolase